VLRGIQIEKVVKKFPGKVAVDGVDLTVDKGEIVALLGSNGAGKTTLLNMIAGFLVPNEGTISVEGMNHFDHYKEIRNRLGYLTNGMALYDKFSVKESLKYLGDLRNIDAKKIDLRTIELVEKLEMGEFITKKFPDLSSGQKQRALIAATIFHDPSILIFDEVTSSLDVLTCRSIMEFLKEERDRGKAILYSTHILSEAEYISDRVSIIHEGKIMKNTNCAELMQEYGCTNMTEAFYRVVSGYKGVA